MAIDSISCIQLKQLMNKDENCALFDIREPGEYNAGHIPGTTSLPRRDIEFRIANLVPVRSTPVVLVGDADKRASLAADTLGVVGYQNVLELEGGIPSWIESGERTPSGVNVASKEFGERVHAGDRVPEIEPHELRKLMDGGTRLVILDARTPEEYGRFCIPGGLSVPGGDLILLADDLRKGPETTVVVNCAGRTRSIIGTQTLRRIGVTNVCALKNGTMGWVLAGLDLEEKPNRAAPSPSAVSRAEAERQAIRVAQDEKIPLLSVTALQDLLAQREALTLYLIDVRSGQEFRDGHIPGFLWIPGGQAVQRADDFIPVRAGTIVFSCDGTARSVMAAYWYRRMGFKNVYALAGGTTAWTENGLQLEKGEPPKKVLGLEQAKKSARFMTSSDLATDQNHKPMVLDVSLSSEYKAGHLPGACWISRGWIEIKIPEIFPDRDMSLVVTCPNEEQSTLAAAVLRELGYRRASVLKGGMEAWKKQDEPLETGLTNALVEPQDVVLSASLTGDKAAMRRYLEWEIKLGKKYERIEAKATARSKSPRIR